MAIPDGGLGGGGGGGGDLSVTDTDAPASTDDAVIDQRTAVADGLGSGLFVNNQVLLLAAVGVAGVAFAVSRRESQ